MTDYSNKKQVFAAALKELMEQRPFSKISVTDICERCGMRRSIFYYHFKDKYDLLTWIYDTELNQTSQQHYANTWELFFDHCNFFYENKAFYKSALQVEGQNSLQDHYKIVLRPFVSDLLVSSQVEPTHRDFYVNFYTDTFIDSLVSWLSARDCIPPDEFLSMMRSCVQALA